MKDLITSELVFTGTQINYYIVCPTKLWLFSRFMTMEHVSDLVSLGLLLHEIYFRNEKKDLIIDQRIAIDFIIKDNNLIIHEIKKSRKLDRAHYYQMLYYLYYLKYEKGIENVKGIINYPSEKRVVEVNLTPEKEIELKKIFQEIKRIVSLPKPPKPERKKYCRKCSYFELCWINK
ncbi:MAG: CRISPR-associated protein Cas4 [Candidatus Aenigmatarchaeota archaeon]